MREKIEVKIGADFDKNFNKQFGHFLENLEKEIDHF
jgi:hypothetical protein